MADKGQEGSQIEGEPGGEHNEKELEVRYLLEKPW